MSDPPPGRGREQAFIAFYQALYADLVRFAARRVDPGHAEDVVADAFVVVWRRFDELPDRHDDARSWVFGITRHLLLNQRRGSQRRRDLGIRLADTAAFFDAGRDADLVVSRVDLSTAWGRLSEAHQETLALAVLDELTAPEAAAVLGISPVAFRLRLHRARRALRLHLDHPPRPTGAPAGLPERPATS